MKLTEAISEAIRQGRQKRRMSQAEFGKRVGVRQSHVARWERNEGKSIPDDTWERLLPLIEDFLDPSIVGIRNETLPLPVIHQLGEDFSNYRKMLNDKLFSYGLSDMEPTVRSGSLLLVDMLESPLEFPRDYLSDAQIRIQVPNDSLIVIQWDDLEDFQIRRASYQQKGAKTVLYLQTDNGSELIPITKDHSFKVFGFVKATVYKKMSNTGFID